MGTTLPSLSRHEPMTVHPHACGDHASRLGVRRGRPVHPHACGDHVEPNYESIDDSGSPPRVWGPPDPRGAHPLCPRFTPTRVGTTAEMSLSPVNVAVHPHACGDHEQLAARPAGEGGSPPRVWGPLLTTFDIRDLSRFTPTRVGTTRSRTARCPCSPVHPHACGDHTLLPTEPSAQLGSPPRVWGPPRQRHGREARHRFTPTRLRTTASHHTSPQDLPVHPHACGDHAIAGNSPSS